MKLLKDVSEILVIGAICFILFLFLMPNIEQGRTEARLAYTYATVRRIHAELRNGEHDAPLEDDPWGHPYRVIPLSNGERRVLSVGPNETTPANAPDGDDVYSDMPESPHRPFERARNRQLLLALVASGGTWILVSALVCWMNHRLG